MDNNASNENDDWEDGLEFLHLGLLNIDNSNCGNSSIYLCDENSYTNNETGSLINIKNYTFYSNIDYDKYFINNFGEVYNLQLNLCNLSHYMV